MNIIFGAGKFSNVHLKVLKEKGIRKAILAKKSSWTEKQKKSFKWFLEKFKPELQLY